MKLKKILAFACSVVMTVSAFAGLTVAHAEAVPTVAVSKVEVADDPYSLGLKVLKVTVSYSGFDDLGFTKYISIPAISRYAGKGLTGIQGEISCSDDSLVVYDVEKLLTGVAAAGGSFGFAWATDDTGMSTNVSGDIVAFYVGKSDYSTSIDENGTYTFGFVEDQQKFTVATKSSADAATSTYYGDNPECTETMNYVSYTYGEVAPKAEVTGITIDPATATVNGGETKDFTAEVTGTGDFDATYTLTASAGTITDNKTFTAPAATEVEQTITITATANGNSEVKATATVTVPAKVADPKFEATATKSATKYYTGVAEDVKEIQVFDVTVANSSLAKWIFTFASASASDSRTFTPDMSSFGDSTVEFDAWIVGAPADVTLTVE